MRSKGNFYQLVVFGLRCDSSPSNPMQQARLSCNSLILYLSVYCCLVIIINKVHVHMAHKYPLTKCESVEVLNMVWSVNLAQSVTFLDSHVT